MTPDLQRRCPRCERVLVETPKGPRCPYCGYDFSVSPEDIDAGEYFTGGECGVLGLLAGLEIGAAIGLVGGDPEADPVLVLLSAGVGAVLGALIAGWVGYRVAPPRRRNFRLLLLAACGAGLGVLVMAVAGWGNVDTVVLVAVGLGGLLYVSGLYAARHGVGKEDSDVSREL